MLAGGKSMSNVAMDNDGQRHYADDFSDVYSGEYFCPNKNCKATMVLKNVGSDEKLYSNRKPYFSATKNLPHVEDCEYSKSSYTYKDLDTTGFKCVTFFENLLKLGGEASDKGSNNGAKEEHSENLYSQNKLTTINKLYQYCLQHSDNSLLPDGKKVFEIYQEKRNEEIYNSRREPYRLVKLGFKNCNFRDFDDEQKCFKIWCYFPHTENTVPPAIYYTLGFEDLNLMNYFCKILNAMKKRDGYVYMVVGGEWIGNHCKITKRRQISILGEKIKR